MAGRRGSSPRTVLFPYNNGLQFTNVTYQADDWAGVDEMYANLPESTEQILHPDKYAAGEAPTRSPCRTDVAPAMGDGWSAKLSGHVRRVPDAGVAAVARRPGRPARPRGWGGDRLTSSRVPTAVGIAVAHGLGHGDRRSGSSFRGAALKAAGGLSTVSSTTKAPRTAGCSSAARAALSAVVNALGLAALAAGPCAYIASGAEIPSSPRVLASVTARVERARGARTSGRAPRGRRPAVAVVRVERGRELRGVRACPASRGRPPRPRRPRAGGQARAEGRLGRPSGERAGDVAPGRGPRRPPCAGSRRWARGRTGRSRPGSRSTAWPARCRSRWRPWARGTEEPARGVDADLGEQLVEGDELAGALGHRHLGAIAHEADPR